MLNWRRLGFVAAAIALATPGTVPAQPEANGATSSDPLSLIGGDWQVVNDEGEVVQECAKAQRFEVTPDRRHVLLTELGNMDWSANYLVLRIEQSRLLMYIEDEERLTEEGDPVLWWAHFAGPDEFRWRRYDWDRNGATSAVWKRCT